MAKQVVHTLVDGGVDRLVDLGEQQSDNPLVDMAIVGAGHKIKNAIHDRVSDFGGEDKPEDAKTEGEYISLAVV